MQQQHFRLRAGFSLIELASVIAVLVITLGIALPGLDRFLAGNRQTALINSFTTSLHQARYHAITHMQRVALCPSSDQRSCSGGFQWESGYISFVDANYNRLRDPQETLLAVNQPDAGNSRITTSQARQKIVFFPSGGSPGSNVTIKFCPGNDKLEPRALILSNSGRARLATPQTDGDKIHC